MIFKSSKEYERLSRKAVLWDSLPFEHINFTGRVVDKYGKNYFNERYSYITGDFYNNIKRSRLDDIDKIIGLSIANSHQPEQQVKNEFIKLMNVPEEYKEIWKNTIPLRYYEDYKERKALLDSYLKTLPPEKQGEAIKIMCLNNQSRNYLAFLDLQEGEMTPEQKILFDDLTNYLENNFFDEISEKQKLADKSIESMKYSRRNQRTTENVNEFLLENDRNNDDVNYARMIENKDRELEFFKHQDVDNPNYRFKVSAPSLDTGSLRDKFINLENMRRQELQDEALSHQPNDQINQNDKSFNKPIYANSYTQGFVDNQVARDQFAPLNKNRNNMFNNNQFNSQFNNLFNQNNDDQNYNNIWQSANQNNNMGLNINNLDARRKQMFNKQNLSSNNVNYKEYIKSPSVYNIVDLINNREIEAANNREVVDQIVRSTIQVNNQYAKQGVKYNSPLVDGKFTTNSNQIPIKSRVNNFQSTSASIPENNTVVSLSQIKNSPRRNDSPFGSQTQVANDDNQGFVSNNSNPFDLSSPVRTRELIKLKTIKPRVANQEQREYVSTNNDINRSTQPSSIQTNKFNQQIRNINTNYNEPTNNERSFNISNNTLNIPQYVNKFDQIVNGSKATSQERTTPNNNNSFVNKENIVSNNENLQFIKPFRPKISLNLDSDFISNYEPSNDTKQNIKKSVESNNARLANDAAANKTKSNDIPVVKRKKATQQKSVRASVRK